jgi:aerobic-type carbon monoxide dehydrogenase small subunit (CoxS/CutS family)
MILGAYALLKKNPKPTPADIARELDGHLCRCGAHDRIVKAIDGAAVAMRGGAR